MVLVEQQASVEVEKEPFFRSKDRFDLSAELGKQGFRDGEPIPLVTGQKIVIEYDSVPSDAVISVDLKPYSAVAKRGYWPDAGTVIGSDIDMSRSGRDEIIPPLTQRNGPRIAFKESSPPSFEVPLDPHLPVGSRVELQIRVHRNGKEIGGASFSYIVDRDFHYSLSSHFQENYQKYREFLRGESKLKSLFTAAKTFFGHVADWDVEVTPTETELIIRVCQM